MNPLGRCRVNIFGRTPPPCAAPPAPASPTGFTGVSYATNMGLVVWWPERRLLVDALLVDVDDDGAGHTCVRCRGHVRWPLVGLSCWPLPVSMVRDSCVFDDVDVLGARWLGRLVA